MGEGKGPMPMKRKAFELLVTVALDGLPWEFRRRLENIEVVVERKPSKEILAERQVKPPNTILGLYHGVPLRNRGTRYANVLPDRITLFQEPIESICRTEKELKEKVQEVVRHEIGHYFGLKEDELGCPR